MSHKSSSKDSEAAGNVATLRAHVANFWVSTSPFFFSTLLFEPVSEAVEVRLFDPDGSQFNELIVNFEENSPGLLDLEPCMAACKFESGLKHARVEVASSKPLSVLARIHSRDWAGVCREAIPCSALRKFVVPLFFGTDRTSVVAVLNRLNEPVEVRARLFIANRSPEVTWKIPPQGCRFVDARQEFADVVEQVKDIAQGYIRLSVVGDKEVYLQAFEVAGSAKQPRYFSFFT